MALLRRVASRPAVPRGADAQRGFTLVELAIVLVVIGLVIAAVLKGQELIDKSRLTSTITKVVQIRAATVHERTRILTDNPHGEIAGCTWIDLRWTMRVRSIPDRQGNKNWIENSYGSRNMEIK